MFRSIRPGPRIAEVWERLIPAALPPPMLAIFFIPRASFRLAPVVIVIGMTVTPIPVRPLLFHFYFDKGPVLSVPLSEVHAVGTVFIVIPIVIVLVVTIVDSVVVLVVSMVFFLSSISIVLRLGRGAYRRRRCKCCRKKKGTEKILISTMHVCSPLA
jgi:hypothetical protein